MCNDPSLCNGLAQSALYTLRYSTPCARKSFVISRNKNVMLHAHAAFPRSTAHEHTRVAAVPKMSAWVDFGATLNDQTDGLISLSSTFLVISVAIGTGAVVDTAIKTPGFSRLVKRVASPTRLPKVVPKDADRGAGRLDRSWKAELRQRRGERRISQIRSEQALSSILRIGIPSALSALAGFLYFDNLSYTLTQTLDPATLRVLASDNSTGQFIQNFLVVIDLLFAILAGNAYAELYQQQESIYFALYNEVSLAKSLLEQLTLVGRARPWYPSALDSMQEYVEEVHLSASECI